MSSRRKTLFRTTAMTCLFLITLCASSWAGVSISQVRVDRQVFNPSQGEEVLLLFQLSEDATATVNVHDPDGQIIAVVAENRHFPQGTASIAWDGRNQEGTVTGNEAYYFSIEVTENNTTLTSYNPATFSGGEKVEINPRIVSDGISYTLSQPARVRIRIGIHDGPLLKTLADWTPNTAGSHQIDWDGMDESKVIDVRSRNFTVDAQAFSLTAASCIVTGGPTTLWEQLAATQSSSLLSTSTITSASAIASQPAMATAVVENSATESTTISRSNLHPHAYQRRATDQAPGFSVTLQPKTSSESNESGDSAEPTLSSSGPVATAALVSQSSSVPTVSGTISMTIDLEELTGLLLSNTRYEIIAYIDDSFFMEDEQGYHPYTFDFETSQFSNGLHTIVFNVATLNDQVGCASIQINIQN